MCKTEELISDQYYHNNWIPCHEHMPDKPELCTIEELSDVDIGTYKEYAKALTEDDIKEKIKEYEENGFNGWSNNLAGAICDLVLERIFKKICVNEK